MTKPNLSFNHIGLFVRDMNRIVSFYVDVMGFFVTDRGRLNGAPITFLSRDPDQHHQVVFVAGRPSDEASTQLNQISFKVASLSELMDFALRLEHEDVSHLEPIIHGNAWSIYFRDPEGNRVEVFSDSDWYINQPIKHHLDFSIGEDEIRRQTYEFCKDKPGFRSITEWRNDMRLLMTSDD